MRGGRAWEETNVDLDLIAQTRHCLGALIAYVVPSVAVLVPLRFLTKVPSFEFRKLLHIVAFTRISLMILSTES